MGRHWPRRPCPSLVACSCSRFASTSVGASPGRPPPSWLLDRARSGGALISTSYSGHKRRERVNQ
uniref:Uncharacterized protein n=1 Tax=Arundo donax TaxID=35708 RepID=A0A0A8XVL9_ARUDO